MIKQRGVVVFIQFVFFVVVVCNFSFFGGVGRALFIFYNIHCCFFFFVCLFFASFLLLRHSICNISRTANHTGVMLLGDPDSQEHKHTMYTFTSRRQAHQHRRLLVNVFHLFLQVGLWSAPSTPPGPSGPLPHLLPRPPPVTWSNSDQVRGGQRERPPQADEKGMQGEKEGDAERREGSDQELC